MPSRTSSACCKTRVSRSSGAGGSTRASTSGASTARRRLRGHIDVARLVRAGGAEQSTLSGSVRGLTAAAADAEPDDVEADEEASMLPESAAADAADPLVEAGCDRVLSLGEGHAGVFPSPRVRSKRVRWFLPRPSFRSSRRWHHERAERLETAK